MDAFSPMPSSIQGDQEPLTPRSKVAKMLADIDNAPTPSPSRLQPQDNRDSARNSPPAAQPLDQSPSHVSRLTTTTRAVFEEDTDSATDDDLDDDIRPRGRAARRMLGDLRSSPPAQQQRRLSGAHESDEDLYSATPRKIPARVTSATPSPSATQHSNGLFVSPSKSVDEDSGDELPSNPFGTKEKLHELIAQKRAERLAREAEDKQKRLASSSDGPDEHSDASQDARRNADIERIMSDATRPTRKASKRALLEMERETQRMARQQALAHQMRVKKKFTTTDLFAKFGYRRAGEDNDAAHQEQTEGETTASSVPNSDGAEELGKAPASTPPSSPPTPLDRQKALVEQGALSKLIPIRQDSLASLAEDDADEELPDLSDIIKSSQRLPKIRDTEQHAGKDKKGLKLARFGKKPAATTGSSSDDELEILPSLPPHLRMFDKAMGSNRVGRPADSKAIHALKHLSHFNVREPLKKGARPSFTPNALEAQLRKRARDQARQQQLERIEELKAKGIDVQTSEEREKEAEAFEDLLEKARQDAVALRKAEKTARKDAGVEDGIPISDDEDEDDEYVGSSEDEEMADAEDEAEGEADDGGLVDDAAEETDEDEEATGESEDEAEVESAEPVGDEEKTGLQEVQPPAEEEMAAAEPVASTPAFAGRKVRKSRVVLDDDEDDEVSGYEDEPNKLHETEQDEDPFAAFNFGAADQHAALMSPTQAFNATMQMPTQATQDESFDILRRMQPPSASLPPTAPDIDTQFDDDSQSNIVQGSQVPESQGISLNWETQLPETPSHAGLHRIISNLSETPGWEPTQDNGMRSPSVAPSMSREKVVDAVWDQETQSTVQLRVSESPMPSQPVQRRSRLGRKRVQIDEDSEDDIAAPAISSKPRKTDAFREMERRRKEALTVTEKAEIDKEMRRMMDEQAEESEDEYAGLGGDDFVAPENEQDRAMIDSSHVEVDERELAAHFAERERLRMEAETSKLYKDLTTGMLRRKMAANTFDLDEDEDEIAARRRQMKQMEEAKKRRALLKDESIASLAGGKQSKGKEAFLKAIADDDDDGDDDVTGVAGEDEAATQDDNTQSQSQPHDVGPLHETSGNKRRIPEGEDSNNDRPPAKQRRTQGPMYKRPTSLLEVQESVSLLLEEPNAGLTSEPMSLDIDSDSDYGDANDDAFEDTDADVEIAAEAARQNDGGYAPNPTSFEAKRMPAPRLPASHRRTAVKPAVVDRLSLKRASSSGSDSAHGRTAWAAGPTTDGFKVPSLLRRATTSNASISSDRGVTTPNLSRENSGVKMGGTKKSSLAYQGRAEERRAIVEASAKRREENTARIAQLRRNSSALSKGLSGRFE